MESHEITNYLTIISPNTLFIGRNLVFLEECNSTNSYALDVFGKSNIAEGTIILTEHQRHGRGQRGNAWESEAGSNLTFSVILLPKWLDLKLQFILTKLVSVSIVQMLSTYRDVAAEIKWPNDIYVGEQKICGVLVENIVQNGAIKASVIGVGLNVNQKDFEYDRAISLSTILGEKVMLKDVMELFCEVFEGNYLRLKQDKTVLDNAYLQHMYRRGEQHLFRVNDKEVWGEIIGVDDEGKLRVNIHQQLQRFAMKEIEFVFS